jgi:hypothetical protein
MGRPSEYKPEYCQAVIKAMSEGVSLSGFAGMIGVSRPTIYEWQTEHSEFSNAVARAKAARVLWWELKLMRSTKGAQTTASIFALRNADPTEWRDVRSVQHDHTVTLQTMTDEQLLAIAQGQGNMIDVTPKK